MKASKRPRKKSPLQRWKINISIETKRPKINNKVLAKVTKAILKSINTRKLKLATTCEIGILITTDAAIRKLNRTYRGKNKPTDVLSFSMIEGPDSLHPAPVLGDVVISLPTAIRQAKEYDVNLYQELLRLLIHGILHLCGHEHEGVSHIQAKNMRAAEERCYLSLLRRSNKLLIS